MTWARRSFAPSQVTNPDWSNRVLLPSEGPLDRPGVEAGWHPLVGGVLIQGAKKDGVQGRADSGDAQEVQHSQANQQNAEDKQLAGAQRGADNEDRNARQHQQKLEESQPEMADKRFAPRLL